MAEVRVDPVALEELAKRLAGLAAEFGGLGELMDDYGRAAGSREVARKLEDFAGNWPDERRRVSEQLERLAAMAAGASVFYREREAALAAGFGGRRRVSGPGD